ncbi:protein ROOT PRIMORDIUM DEFECTIVE 1 [Panicum miliaceum]|uniref:Protein ROOT PRIMORDIUM DEFECTIVE 1 n=1 Tax=Panicum miliaceum TaxID=4540 RepID=A0A3L6SWU9_PANMI|nr:protein ROOT PRIMORDIUM DEFECTIVE 1 [Panicum miliaceum]
MASIIFGPGNMHALSVRLRIFAGSGTFQYGPFICGVQQRWKKPVDSARTHLEGRTRDHRLDKLMVQLRNLRLALALHELISQQRNEYVSLQLLSKWRHEVGLNIEIGAFLKKYPHIFQIYMHPVKRNHCCKITQKMTDLIAEEEAVIRENETNIVQRLKKLLMLSTNGTLNMHTLWLIEEWRKKEYTEKWLAESKTKYAFPINFPTGFKIEKGFREKLKNWQRLPYTKPYEKNDLHPIHNVEQIEKRIVGILHELLSLTVEKMIPLERLSHFRRVFAMEVNLRELLLKHPGIFYISTKGSAQTVILREIYSKGCLVEPNPVYDMRRKMLDLILSGCRNVGEPESATFFAEEYDQASCHELQKNMCEVDTANTILELETDSDSYRKEVYC